MRVLASINQKGGVGKTTLCANLAYAMSELGAKILVLDLDPQGHLGQSFGFFQTHQSGMDDLLLGKAPLNDVIKQVNPNLQLVAAGPQLQRLEVMPMAKGRGLVLTKWLDKNPIDVDIVMLDCPPSSGFLTVNALAAAQELLVPVTPDYFGLAGVSLLLATIRNFEAKRGPYQRKWVVVNRMQRRRLTDEVLKKLRHYFKQDLVPVQLHERAVIAESPSHGTPVLAYAPRSESAQQFKQLARLILDNRGTEDGEQR